MSGGRGRARARLAALSLIALGALGLTFRRADAAALRASLASVDLLWLAVAIAGVAGATLLAVVRWRVLFFPDRSRSWRNLACALLVGQMANVLLPLRLGEIARVALVSEAEQLAPARALATIAVERLADVVMLGMATVFVFVTISVPAALQGSGRAVVALAAASLAVAVALTFEPDRLLRSAVVATSRLPARFGERIAAHAAHALDGLHALRSRQWALAFWGLSAACFLSAAGVNYLLFRAFHLPLTLSSAVLLLVVLQVGNTAVSVPGNLGVFHYLTVLVLTARSVDRDTALAYAIVLYAITLVPKVVLGAAILAAAPAGFGFAAALRLRGGGSPR
jgi:uncharacterized protein (TIRG00374 family)